MSSPEPRSDKAKGKAKLETSPSASPPPEPLMYPEAEKLKNVSLRREERVGFSSVASDPGSIKDSESDAMSTTTMDTTTSAGTLMSGASTAFIETKVHFFTLDEFAGHEIETILEDGEHEHEDGVSGTALEDAQSVRPGSVLSDIGERLNDVQVGAPAPLSALSLSPAPFPPLAQPPPPPPPTSTRRCLPRLSPPLSARAQDARDAQREERHARHESKERARKGAEYREHGEDDDDDESEGRRGGASAPGSSAGHAAETQYALLIEQMQHRELTSEDLQLFMSLEQQASKEGYTPGPSSSGLYRGLAGGLAGPAGPSSWTGAGSAGPGSVGTGSVGSLGTDSVGPYKPHSALGSLGGGSVT